MKNPETAGYTRAWCPQCGPGVVFDEDGCCAICGAQATGEGAELAFRHRDALNKHDASILRWAARSWAKGSDVRQTLEQLADACESTPTDKPAKSVQENDSLRDLVKEMGAWIAASAPLTSAAVVGSSLDLAAEHERTGAALLARAKALGCEP